MFENSQRAELARELSRVSRLNFQQLLAQELSPKSKSQRIGFTGPPGVGKSTLIANWAERRLARNRSVGVLAVDPSSPISQGAILGDRIRMDSLDCRENFYMRSVASTRVQDGLCHNALGLLEVFDRFGFDDSVLETVGVGQTEYSIRILVDTVVLALLPNSGDIIQAMKSGIIEVADIYVVNKSDLPGADMLVKELENILSFRQDSSSWRPQVVQVSSVESTGLEVLDALIQEHFDWQQANVDPYQVERRRQEYRLGALINYQLQEFIQSNRMNKDGDLVEAYSQLVKRLSSTTDI